MQLKAERLRNLAGILLADKSQTLSLLLFTHSVLGNKADSLERQWDPASCTAPNYTLSVDNRRKRDLGECSGQLQLAKSQGKQPKLNNENNGLY